MTIINDAGLTHPTGSTNINDAGLTHLAGSTSLRYLFLNGAHITDAGVKELQRALPGCRISR